MRNKFNNGELVLVNGKGKIFKDEVNKLGFILDKDFYYNDYYIELIFGKKDWFKEKNITRVLGHKKNRVYKYKVRLCTTKKGYEMINQNIETNKPISNNKLKQITFCKEFNVKGKKYVVIGWDSVFWPVSNKSIMIIENTIKEFRKHNIPFQYIVINEEDFTDITKYEFTINDKNVDRFSIVIDIKMKD